MSPTQETPLAEAADRRWQLMSIVMLLLGLRSAISAAMLVVDHPFMRHLEWAEAAAALSAVGVVLYLAIYKLTKVPASQRSHFLNMEGYVKETMRKACWSSWSATLVTLMFFSVLGDEWFTSVPAEFFLDASIAVMLGVFSIAFFVMNASSNDEEGAVGA